MLNVENSVEYVDKFPMHPIFSFMHSKCISSYVNHEGKYFKTISILSFTLLCYNKIQIEDQKRQIAF